MEPFHLHVENRIRVQQNALLLSCIGGKVLFVPPLDARKAAQHLPVIGVSVQPSKGLGLHEIRLAPREIAHQSVKSGVNFRQPAPVVHAVGDVGELLRFHGAGVLKHVFF
ncbi:hypothetical protein SDC9_186679 [bioreactor metagenome]|uniref:Uncharacterized protein n=1 Tax=bioreactor metagenome TaxID=1076179 RepID=A0A645HJF4_9ZZZZ